MTWKEATKLLFEAPTGLKVDFKGVIEHLKGFDAPKILLNDTGEYMQDWSSIEGVMSIRVAQYKWPSTFGKNRN